jgi:TPR repeat protein
MCHAGGLSEFRHQGGSIMRFLSLGTNTSELKSSAVSIAVLLCSAFVHTAAATPQNSDPPPALCLRADLSASSRRTHPSAAEHAVTPPASTEAYSQNEKGIAAITGQPSDLRAAHRWFEKAARKGYAPAQVNLAITYSQGWGTARNDGAVLYWLTLAAKQGNERALFNLGQLYLEGCGVRRNYPEALRLFREAAEKGETAAQINLGYLYDHGLAVPKDQTQGAAWYKKAADAGEPQAQFNLADLYVRGEGVAQNDLLAFQWFQKAALQGHGGARVMLGAMYASGRGTQKDLETGYVWILSADLEADPHIRTSAVSLERQLSPAQLERARMRARLLAPAGHIELALLY